MPGGLEIQYRPVAGLKPYVGNARTHSAAQISQIADAIRAFGWTNPILVDEGGGIIAGHGRLAAATQLGMPEVPTICLAGLTATQRRALVVADNRLAENAGWNEQLLAAELGALRLEDFDLSLTGFSEQEIDALMARQAAHSGLTGPDAVPDTPADPVSRVGDLWLCGRHRVICGDATSDADVRALLGEVRPHLMVTDPLYGVEYDANWRNDDRADWREAFDLFPGDVAYAWSAGLRSKQSIEGLEAAGFEIRAQIIWAKQQFAISRGHYHFQHEPCWYAVRKGRTGHWAGDRKQTTLWQIDKPQKSETGHSTQKPVECMKRPIENNSSPGQAVYDPFLGSGTTMVAAEMTGRSCLGSEISPAYVDVIVQRWQEFTGQQATLNGRTFLEVANERKKAYPDAPEAGAGKPGAAPAKRSRAKAGAVAPDAAAAS